MADKIKILDYVCGTGKSTWILNKLKSVSAPRFIYISCLLSEIEDRVQEELAHLDICIPSDENGTKSEDALIALKEGRSIAATHSLFLRLNEEAVKLIKEWEYVLVIDEVLDFITPYRKYSSQDVKDLVNLNQITVDTENKGRVHVNQEFQGYYSELKEYSEKGLVYASVDGFTVFNLQIPPSVIKASKECYVLTYLYDSSEMQRFLTLHNIDYEHLDVPELAQREISIKKYLKENINLIQIKSADDIVRSLRSTRNNAFSYNWWSTKKDKAELFLKKVDNWLHNNKHRSDFFFTTPKEIFDKRGLATKKSLGLNCLKPSIVSDSNDEVQLWLASSTKATNEYADRKLCLFLMNTYPNVGLQKYFEQYCTQLDNDRYALSELVQFLFRGCIRKGEPMDLYIASPRMKELFVDWLDTTIGNRR